MKKYNVGYSELNTLVNALRGRILASLLPEPNRQRTLAVYGVPRGGVPVALALMGTGPFMMTEDPDHADVIVDDLIDSGRTMARFPGKHFDALIDKRNHFLPNTNGMARNPHHGRWIVFPWESGSDGDVEDNVRRLIQFVGDDPEREGLLETPHRVSKAWAEWCEGYGTDPSDVLKVFEDGAEGCDEMVVVKDLPFYSKCEHHMADIFGTATIAYVPDGKIVGLSKLDRLLEVFARRLQVQERLTAQVADALMEHLGAKGAGVVIKARHMCMESRGVRKQGHHTVTSALRGVFKDQPSTRAEFLALAR